MTNAHGVTSQHVSAGLDHFVSHPDQIKSLAQAALKHIPGGQAAIARTFPQAEKPSPHVLPKIYNQTLYSGFEFGR